MLHPLAQIWPEIIERMKNSLGYQDIKLEGTKMHSFAKLLGRNIFAPFGPLYNEITSYPYIEGRLT